MLVVSTGAGPRGGAAGGAGAEGGLERVLLRLVDPATSNRRTEAARTRLANHPTTRALVEAGVAVLLEEIGGPSRTGPAGAPPPGDLPHARFFEALSVRRVAAAATAVGPLRTTSSHLRDRWAHRADYVEDLFAYTLWPQHWSTVFTARLHHLQPPQRGTDLPRLCAAVAEANLVVGAIPVSARMEVLASALGPVRPALRAARARAQLELNARWAATWSDLFASAGFRARSHDHLLDGTRAAAALAEGANLRLLALGDTPERRAEAVRLLVTGGMALARSCVEPTGASRAPAPAVPFWAFGGEPDIAAVLTRLTDPATGARRTDGGRQRLARDGITRQLLLGGLEVLAQEFGVTRPRPEDASGTPPPREPSHFFDVLSVARVVATARAAGGAGASASSARLRDRWPSQEHFVDDVVAFAVQRASLVVASIERQDEGAVSAMRRAAAARFAEVDESPGLRLRLLLTTLAQARPVVAARLREVHEREDEVLTQRVQELLSATGARLRDDVDLLDLSRAIGALGEGMALRALATGDTGETTAGLGHPGDPLAVRAATAVYQGALAPGASGPHPSA